jgi:hypothetical protein
VLTALPAWLLALLGIAGLLSTIRAAPPAPPTRQPVRFVAGTPLAERLVIVLVPQLDAAGALALRAALGPDEATPAAAVAIDRPGFASFDEISLQLLAGNVADGVAPPTSTDGAAQSPDSIVRGVAGQERGVALIGQEGWRSLFGVVAPPSPTAAPVPAPKTPTLLADADSALASRRAALTLLQLRELTAREVRDDPTVRGGLAALGERLGPRDALIVIAGSGGGDLLVSLSGAGSRTSPLRTLAANDFAPLCAVLLGAPYPSESRGRIAWSLLMVDDARKAEATARLARQRTGLVANTLPFGTAYPPDLLAAMSQHPAIDSAIESQHYSYAYQLASSVLDQADRQFVATVDTPTLPVPRRAAPWLVVAGIVAALYAVLLALAGRLWGTLGAAAAGAALAAAAWFGTATLLQRLVTPNPAFVIALGLMQGIVGGGVCAVLAWFLGRAVVGGRDDAGGWRATELLALLAAIPIAFAAYRYGLPWQLRLEESAPLFRWRSALLAPLALLLLGYGWTLVLRWRERRVAR